MSDLDAAIKDRIRGEGPMPFDEFMANALYAPRLGFYQRGGGAGRRRDFLTSPEVGPLFGAVIARALDAWWVELGRPSSFVVVDAGAGPGTLARSILAAAPACSDVLDLVLVEVGRAQWASHPEGVTTMDELPEAGTFGAGPVVVLANELLDNLPFGLVELTPDGWQEVCVGVDAGGTLVEALAPIGPAQQAWCEDRVAGSVPVGARLPVQSHAAEWLGGALALASRGRVVVIDYATTSADLARRPRAEWMRTYADHGRAGPALVDPGSRDITCEVAIDQLALVSPPAIDRDQATFLRDHGMDPLVAEGRDRWLAEGLGGGLGAIAGQSRRIEAQALTDPAGLGAFRVLEWCPGTEQDG